METIETHYRESGITRIYRSTGESVQHAALRAKHPHGFTIQYSAKDICPTSIEAKVTHPAYGQPDTLFIIGRRRGVERGEE